MARGLQAQQSREKAQAKAKAAAGGKSNLDSRAKALKVKCPKCFTPMSDYKNFKEHFEAKHPKDPLPAESALQTVA